MFMKTQTTKM